MADIATGVAFTFTEAVARRALTQAGRRASLPAEPVELIRIGSNAVFRVGEDVIARVAPPWASSANAQKQIRVARWLKDVGYPATRAVDVEQPIEAEGCAVTFWESVAPGTTYAPIGDVARLIRQLHELPTLADLDLPEIQPFGPIDGDLPAFDGLPQEEAEFLRGRIKWARATFPTLPFALPRGVIHGDANVGNVLVDLSGRPVLIDLDSFSTGPREWDLIQTALFAKRLGWHTWAEYDEFVRIYGYDLTEWSAFGELADMREIAMTSWLSRKATASESTRIEAVKRIHDIRDGEERHGWGAN